MPTSVRSIIIVRDQSRHSDRVAVLHAKDRDAERHIVFRFDRLTCTVNWHG